ncbi:hypothetical protein I6N90_11340 [Paenibacillus sp. GSMTC-2017]|uniref:hypothetical protein n=1 Tax=Paenibacillus sp. GSMTC-2017 TaxID=2794350 RepID=UPI0018D60F5B|nr:hypothetical protein [Paenibacillus sp. GSMTC-2017]MBH5318402.1 hypothetical protein [Paenibacillus sp. GSMTC-2017]
MNKVNEQTTWLNDYLDLYNFAGQINDTAWQEELLQIIRSGPSGENSINKHELGKEELWGEFNLLNHKLLQLFAQIKTSNSLFEIETVQQLIQSLKQRRLEVGRQLI